MIRVVRYTKRDIVEGSINDLNPSKKFAWVDCLNPTQEEFKELSEKTGIPIEILKNSLDDDLRPRAIDVGDYSEFVFRASFSKKKGVHDVRNFAVFTCANKSNLIVLRKYKIKAIENIIKLPLDSKKVMMAKGIGYLLFRICDEVFFEFFEVMDDFEDEIENIEDRIFHIKDKRLLANIFNTKKTLIYFHKALSANREAIANIQKEFITGIEKRHTRIFRDLYSDCTQLIDLVTTYRDLLTGALEIHLSAASNNLNEIAKLLSAVAAIIMVPTLITGIYGMNFKHMPELTWKFGYPMAIGAIVISAIVLFIIFRKKEWL
jgi:magnesium transporter